MGSPIAAGSVVVPRGSIAAFQLETHRPLLGVCESASAPGAPGDPPTNVIVAWEDGTRVTYAVAAGLLSAVVPTSPSLLGTVMQFNGQVIPPSLLEAGTRLRGPVVAHAQYFLPNGDAVAEIATLKTPFGYADFAVIGLGAVPGV